MPLPPINNRIAASIAAGVLCLVLGVGLSYLKPGPASAPSPTPAPQPVAVEYVIPDQQIVVKPAKPYYGELVSLSIAPPKEKPANLASTSYEWKVFDQDGQEKSVEAGRDANRFFFGAGVKPAKLKAVVAVTYLYIVKTAGTVSDVATRTVVLEANIPIGDGTNPQPPPGPAPNPNPPTPHPPTPNPPANSPTFTGQLGLDKFAYDVAMVKVSPDGRAAACKALAASFRGIASAIRAGTLNDNETLLKQTKANNDAALTELKAIEHWGDWSTALQDTVFSLYDSNKIVNPKDFAAAWDEIASGLEQVK